MSRGILGILVILLVAAAGVGAYYWSFGRSAETLRLHGVVEIQEVALGSKVAGRVAKVVAREGDVVEPGQPLVYLELPELQAQRAQLEAKLLAAEAELRKARYGPRQEEKDSAEAAALAAKAQWDRLKAGWRKEELAQAAAKVKMTEADLQQTVIEYELQDKLRKQKSGTQLDYDNAMARRSRADATVADARAYHEMLQTGSRPEDVRAAEHEWKRVHARYRELLAGTRPEDITVAEAQVGELRARLQELDVLLKEEIVSAPEKAVVEVIAVRKGTLVAPNAPIVRVLRAEDMWVKIYVPETELGKLRLQQAVDVTVDAYPGRIFKGKVAQVAAVSEFTPRNVQSPDERRYQVFGVKIHIADPQGVFKSGMAAAVVIPLAPAP